MFFFFSESSLETVHLQALSGIILAATVSETETANTETNQ